MLLWELSAFDGWLILDGHDRAVAALAEGYEPASVILARGNSLNKQTAIIQAMTADRRREDAATEGQIPPHYLSMAVAAVPIDHARTTA